MISCIINTCHIKLKITNCNFVFLTKKTILRINLKNETFIDKKLKLNKKAISKLQLEKIVGGNETVVAPELGESITTFRFICTNHPTQNTIRCPKSSRCPQQSQMVC